LANPTAYNTDVVKATGCSQHLVSDVRSELIKEGLLRPATQDYTSQHNAYVAPEGPAALEAQGIDELATAITRQISKRGEIYTDEQILQKLSAIADDQSQTAQTQIAASVAIHRIKQAQGARDKLGPGPPLDDEAKIHRLSLLLEACGRKISYQAWRCAFKKASQQAQTSPSPPETPQESRSDPPPEAPGLGMREGDVGAEPIGP
jgi:hypothetical protein